MLPQVAGLLWVIYYWFRNRDEWNWRQHGMLVLVCSIACSYYSYPYDQILVLPALVAVYAAGNRRVFLPLFIAANLGFFLYVFRVAGAFGFGYMFLSWTPAAWLIVFLVSRSTVWQSRGKELIRT
jgi:hypothetical protein